MKNRIESKLMVIGIILSLMLVTVPTIGKNVDISNRPPDRPKVTGPFPLPVPLYECTIRTIDPDGDNVSYQIDWADGPISGWTVWYPSGVEITQNHTYSEAGCEYHIRARAKDVCGAIGEWGLITFGKSSQQSSSMPSSQSVMSIIPSTGSMVFNNDTTPPEIEVTWEVFKDGSIWYIDFICEAYDEESGMDRVEMFINDEFYEEIVGAGPIYEFIVERHIVFKNVFKFVAYNGADLSAFVIINGSDIKSYSRSHSSSQQSSSTPSSQSVMSIIPSTGIMVVENELLSELIIVGPTHGVVGYPLLYGFLLTNQEGCDDIWYYADWGDGTSWGWYGPVPSGITIYKAHAWNKDGTYPILVKAKDCEGSIYNATYEVIIYQRPTVEIVNPREGYFHFSGIPLFPTVLNFLADTVSFGGCKLRPIQVNATGGNSEHGELMVWLYIGDEDKGYGTWNPETGYYEWQWTEKALGTYMFRVKARDIYGAESNWASLDIWNFCFMP